MFEGGATDFPSFSPGEDGGELGKLFCFSSGTRLSSGWGETRREGTRRSFSSSSDLASSSLSEGRGELGGQDVGESRRESTRRSLESEL